MTKFHSSVQWVKTMTMIFIIIIIMFFKNTFVAIIQSNNSGAERKIVTIVHICSDIELMTLVLCVHLKTGWLYRSYSATRLKMCVKHPCFRISSFFEAAFIFELLSSVIAKTLLSELALLAKHLNKYKKNTILQSQAEAYNKVRWFF